MCILAFIALTGAVSAFSLHHTSQFYSFTYGVTGLTANRHGYNVVPFDYDNCTCQGAYYTCAIQSRTVRSSPVPTTAIGIIKWPGIYVFR